MAILQQLSQQCLGEETVMRIITISQDECSELLKRLYIGRLGCALDNQPNIVPVYFSYEPDSIYIFSTLGKKIEWMRQNPKVCLQTDEIVNGLEWLSLIVTGTYLELTGPQYEAQREHAQKRLAEYSEWWRIPLAERREQTRDLLIQTVFFRINIESMSGLRAMYEDEETARSWRSN
jgi:nitroimidazol reductase NimA-like FMN-containing flavoprotein (pyridoxamine 5'-phosphate oxidase superfamily)